MDEMILKKIIRRLTKYHKAEVKRLSKHILTRHDSEYVRGFKEGIKIVIDWLDDLEFE